MLTVAEMRLRAEILCARITRTGYDNELRVTLNEWTREEAERKAYYTDDREDAILTAGTMRRLQGALRAA